MSFPLKHSLERFHPRVYTNKVFLLILGGWLFLSVTQTLHFYWYFEQSLWNSIRWSFRDWFVWFALFACIYAFCADKARFSTFSLLTVFLVACIAFGSGILQTLIITALDFIAGTASRPFWEDFSHFYRKRWLQHLFIFVVFWLLMLNRILIRDGSSENASDALSVPVNEKIKVSDGKEHVWLSQSDIFSIEAAGNYICFHTTQGQLIVRASLKSIEKTLDQQMFVRVSRSNIVKLSAINSSRRRSRSKVELVLANEQTVTIGSTYWRAIKTRLSL